MSAVKKAVKKSTEVAVKPAGAVVDYMAMLTKHATSDVAQVAKVGNSGGNRMSFAGATITVGGNKLGNSLPVIILKVQSERTFYSRDYVAGNSSVPDCYSYDMQAPHEKASAKQAESCADCAHNQWGSDRRGKGKACREGLRAAMVAAREPLTAEAITDGPMVTAGFSVLNSKDARDYVAAVTDRLGSVARAVTVLGVQGDPNRQILNTFQFEDKVPDKLLPAVAGRLEEAERLLTQPYPEVDASKQAAPAAAGKVRRF